jgi:hypothetical protein
VGVKRPHGAGADRSPGGEEFGDSVGKTVIVARDMPGFVVNRLLIPYLLDSFRIYGAGLTTREDIDQGMALGCNHPMGPLTLSDLIGLDTVYFIANAMYEEFKELFPENAVEYFVSYYDYYQPEAYVPQTDTYIAKDVSINEEIDRLRHSATQSLLTRSDIIVVASVSCLYGIGSPIEYLKAAFKDS